MHSGIVRGYYGAQLERGLLRVRARSSSTWWSSARSSRTTRPHLDRITEFLGIHAFRKYPDLPNAFPGKPTVIGTAPTGADIDHLVDVYRADFAKFKELSGLDVSAWPLQRLLDGDLDADELAAQYAKKVVATRPTTDAPPTRRFLTERADPCQDDGSMRFP